MENNYDNNIEIEYGDSFIEYAYCDENIFNERIKDLSFIAEKEKWGIEDGDFSILKTYIYKTFSRCKMQNKISVSDDGEYSIFNTGLLTNNGQEIFGLFRKNRHRNKSNPYFFVGFYKEDSHELMGKFNSNEFPRLASYSDDFSDFYFDATLPILFNLDHILDENWPRISETLGVNIPKKIVKTMFKGVVDIAIKKIKRNMRLVVPQYYNDNIQYLIPIVFPISDEEDVTMALVVQKYNMQYRANTIFDLEMAYKNARLLMKPESDWLT